MDGIAFCFRKKIQKAIIQLRVVGIVEINTTLNSVEFV